MREKNRINYHVRGVFTLLVMLGLLLPVTNLVSVHATETPDSLVYALPYGVSKVSILNGYDYSMLQWASSLFVGLYARDARNNRLYSPVLASAAPVIEVNGTDFQSSEYAMKLTVSLKPGLKFSDGTPLTADDVIYTYRLFLSPAISPYYWITLHPFFPSNYSFIKVDDTTVKFHVKQFISTFYELLDKPIVPQEIYQPAVDAHDYSFTTNYESFIIGAGPFKLESMDTVNNVLSVVRNPNWVGTTPPLERIYFTNIATRDQAIEALETGNVQILHGDYFFTREQAESLSTSASILVPDVFSCEFSLNHIHPVFGDTAQQDQFIGKTYNYSGNQYTIYSYWKDQGITDENARREHARLVREAMDTVIPREKIINESLNGLAVPLATVWPTVAIGYDPSLQPRSYNLTAARGLMEQAGFDYASLQYDSTQDTYTTFFFNITVLSPFSHFPDPHENLQESFSKIGIGVTINKTDWVDIVPRTLDYEVPSPDAPVPLYDQGGYDALIFGYYSSLEPDYHGLYESTQWNGMGGNNWYNYYDPSYDELNYQYEHTLDPNTKTNFAKEMQHYFYEHLIVNALYEPARYWFYSPELHGIDFVLLNLASLQWELVNYGSSSTTTTTTINTSTTSTKSTLPFNGLILTQIISLLAILFIKKYRYVISN